MKVSRYNYKAQFPDGVNMVVDGIADILIAGRYILSQEVADFEAAFARYNGTRFARGVNSGTDALIIALQALGVGKGDEVITHANTFHATVLAIVSVGATPVLVDADNHSFLIDAGQLQSAICGRTKAIVPVHLFGKPTPMTPVLEAARRCGAHVVEDAAQAHGARWNGKCVGSIGDLGCFSFHPSKNLAAAGDAGAIITSSERLMEAIDEIRSLGQQGQNNHVRLGCNSKLDAIQSIVLSAKLGHLDKWNENRRNTARLYRELLSRVPVTFQSNEVGEEHVYHLFQIRTSSRDALHKALLKNGIDAVVRYPTPIHMQPAFSELGLREGAFPVSERLAKELLALPIRADMEHGEIEFVCDRIREFFVGT